MQPSRQFHFADRVLILVLTLLLLMRCTSGQSQSLTTSTTDPVQPEQPQKTTLKQFPVNLGKDFLGLFCSDNILPAITGTAATGIATTADDRIHNYFSGKDTDRPLGNIGDTMGQPVVLIPAIGTVLLLGLPSKNVRFHSFSYALAEGFVLNSALTAGLKAAVARDRPDSTSPKSFPSGHASDYIMIATTVDHYYGHTVGFLMYGLATYVSASRLVKDKHWLSDVVAGASLGYIVGRTVSRRTDGLPPRNVEWTPFVDPSRKGLGVAFTIRIP